MKETEVLDLFTKTGAYLQGHFKLSSGLHSGAYLQCALVLQNPFVASRLCSELAKKFDGSEPDVVLGPAMGGIVLAYELARNTESRAIFSERDDNGKMVLRRGFSVSSDTKILIAEDVLTTGKSVKEVVEMLKLEGIRPVGIASLIDRSGRELDFDGIRYESLLKLDVPVYKEENCPMCREGRPVVKPGSRKKF